jgi:type II secretory pathway predicted ATPase ExeA
VPERKLISFVFFGLPDIERNLRLDPPLAQRVAMRYRLEPLNAESTRSYVEHRIHTAGGGHNPFSPAAIDVLHRVSGGSPRIINTLCDNALFEAFLGGETSVDAPRIEEIARNLAFGSAEASGGNGAPISAAAGNVDLSEVDRYLESLKS